MVRRFMSIAGGMALVGACVLGCESKKIGDACETYRSSECSGPGATCLGNNAGNYCTITCGAASECPSGWKCENVASVSINGKGQKTDEKAVKMCVKT
jgi:hypothetical protein